MADGRAGLTVGWLPTFVVIGAQKSGTTSLIHHLGEHPDVFALKREVHFFDRHLDRGAEWYRQRFAAAGHERAIGEGTPEYMYVDGVAPRLAALLPDARLIAILRNPVDRAYSQYWHNRTRGHEPLDFESALAAEPERLRAADARQRARYAYVDRGRYLGQLERICDQFPRSALEIVLFEDLCRAPVPVVQSLYRFLDVDHQVVPNGVGRKRNPFIVYRSQRLREPISGLPFPLQRLAFRLNTKRTTYPAMPNDLREELHDGFAPDNAALARWLGRDLSAWGVTGS
ncbi:MAG: sulfotransferase family protein [Acidimicrobiales bacterium]